MVVNFWLLLLFTHSLLIKRPVGWVYFLPLGAVSSIERSDILMVVVAKVLKDGLWNVLGDTVRGADISDKEWPLKCLLIGK
jgi:hypothetical protein